MTAAGSILGTPSFMAPEQARGEEADERTDVYALGAILYTVLTGKPPYQGGDPAAIMERVLAEPPTPIGTLEPGVPDDLQTIVARAMARERSARYPSAKELAADLKRFQTGQLVAAHRYSRWQLAMRWLRRHRGAVFVGLIAAVVLAVLAIGSLTRIVRERDRARTAEQVASGRADALVLAQARATVETDPLQAIKGLAELSLGSTHWPAARQVAADAVARGLPKFVFDTNGIGELELSPDGKLLAYGKKDELRIRDLATNTERTLGKHADQINDLMFSHDGTRIATASNDNTVGIWTLDGAPPRLLKGHEGLVFGVQFSADDLHVISSGLDRTTRIWSLATGEARVVPTLLRGRTASADLRWILGIEPQSAYGSAIWDVATGKRVLELGYRCAAFLPDKPMAIIAGDGKVVQRDMTTGVETKLGDLSDRCTEIAIGSDGRIVLGVSTGSILVSEPGEKIHTWTYRGLTRPVSGLQIRKDGAYVLAWGAEGAVHLIDTRTRTGQALAGSRGDALFAGDDRVFAFNADRGLLAWTTTRGGRVFKANQTTRQAAISPDGATLASGGTGWALRLTEVATGQTRDLRGHRSVVVYTAFSPNAALVASLDEDHRVRLWERASGKTVELPGRGQSGIEFSPDGELLASIGDHEDISLWTVATGAVRSLAGGHKGIIFALAFSPRGGVLASGGGDHTVRIWNTATGENRVAGTHDAPVRAIAFSPDGAWIAAVDEAAHVKLWPVAGGTPRTLTGHTGWLHAVTFDPSGRMLATAGTDKSVRVWDVATGAGRVLGSHADIVLDVAFSPDGLTLASACVDGSARLWDVASSDGRALAGHSSWVWNALWFPDGTQVATTGVDGTIRVWSDELPREPAALRDWLVSASR
jgi:WD40 repeat protein